MLDVSISRNGIKFCIEEHTFCGARTQNAWWILRLGSQFTCLRWERVSYNGKTSWGQLNGPKMKESRVWSKFSFPLFASQGGSSLELNFSFLVVSHSFLSTISLLPIFPTPFLTPLTHIYRLPLVGLSWWWSCFLCWRAYLGYNPNHMGPTSCNRCDFLETCTRSQIGRQFPPRHYHYCPM